MGTSLPVGTTLTCANNGKATYFNSSGVLTTVNANNFARFNYNPVALTLNGLLIEQATTNLQIQSQLASGWAATAGTLTLNTTVAPDGTTTGATLADNTSNSSHHLDMPAQIAFTSGTTITYSIFAKAGTNSFFQMGPGGNAFSGSTAFANFDLANGVVGSTSGTVASGIQAAGSGWYQCWAAFTPTVTDNGFVVTYTITAANSARAQAYVGTGTTIMLWGAQVEAAAFATSYVATTAAAVSRAADVLVASVPNGTYNITINRLSGATVLTSQSVPSGYTVPVSESELQSLVMQRIA